MNKRKIIPVILTIIFCCIAGLKAENIINPEPNQSHYKPRQINEIADNILLYQKDNGGWAKNYDMLAILTQEQKAKLIKAKNALNTTFDNGTTYSQIEYLAKAYKIAKIDKYKDACLRGIDFTLSAQYPNGGWPQGFPLESKYTRHITFNDGAFIGIMKMLKNTNDEKPEYSFVDSKLRKKIKTAFEKGLDCIIKCQIYDNGKLTSWCQQHSEIDFQPVKGRAYELPSICNYEGANVVLFLMSINEPTKEIINSIEAAVNWFEESKILGIKVDEINGLITEDLLAPPIWSRFYELGTHRPLFSDRRGKPLYSLAEVDSERRSNYSWFTYKPQKVLDKYPAWRKNIKK